MKRVIRNKVFETNSSSSHSVTVRGKAHVENHYTLPDIIKIRLGEYGWGYDRLWGFKDKLAYALSMILCTEYPNYNHYDEEYIINQDVLESLDGYKILLDAINKHGECNAIEIIRQGGFYPYGYIDHQSCNYSSLQDFLDDWNIDAERLLFDDSVSIIIDNDNH